nr:hypothetical protein [Tanacetum cinerariifolium]
MQNIPYASAVGSIMNAVRCTRPNVAFAQNMTSRFQHNPGEKHWTAVKIILKYLRNTKDMFLVYGGNMERELRVSCYTDAGYLTDADNLKSQTGYEVVWIRKFIYGLGIVPTIKEPISMYCDNIEAIAIAKDDGVTKGARHFRANVHYLCETIKLGDVKIEKIHTYDNLADPFTKALAKEVVWIRKFIYGLGIVPTIKEPISMYCDNIEAIAIAKDDGVTKGARHFRANVHYLCETIKLGDVKIEKIHTYDNLADLFTKALAFSKHSELTWNIGLLPASSFM